MENKEKKSGRLSSTIVAILSFIVTLPLFILLDRVIPDLNWFWNLDKFLLWIIIYTIIEFIFESVKISAIIVFVLAISWLTYGSFTEKYGFKEVFYDYRGLIFSMKNSPHPEDFIISKVMPFNNKTQIVNAIDYSNPDVMTFARKSATEYFNEEQKKYHKYRTLIQCFSIFKVINSNWKYVYDPKNEEYYAKASESIKTLAGDCDDHSILMAACIKAVGGTARLIHTERHLYPELLIGSESDLEIVNYLINKETFSISKTDYSSNYIVERGKLRFKKNAKTSQQTLHYHTDERGQIWLNMDYTANYPGGKFMNDKILGVLNLP